MLPVVYVTAVGLWSKGEQTTLSEGVGKREEVAREITRLSTPNVHRRPRDKVRPLQSGWGEESAF